MERKQITRFVLIALYAALIAAGAFIRIPFVPVPLTLQTFFALLAAGTLPVCMALFSVLVYLFLGAAGLPVFTSGGGMAALLGPTGGYLAGLVPAVLIGSLLMKVPFFRGRAGYAVSSVAATAVIYAVGIPWLGYSMDIPLASAFISGLLPFIAGDVLKIIVTVAAAPLIRPRIEELLSRN